MKRTLVHNLFTLILAGICAIVTNGQSIGSAGTVGGTVVDQNQAAIPNATVTLANPVSGYKRTTVTDSIGAFRFSDVPPNTYQLTVSASGFSDAQQSVT